MNSKVALIAGFLFLTTFVCCTFVAADNEFNVVPKLYEEIGCTETKNSGKKSFECPDFTTYDTNKCHLSGKTFKVGDEIEGDFVPSCRAGCRCIKNDANAHIECANVECPELFGRRNWDCLSQYDNLKQCCRSSEICDQVKIRSMNTCEVDGKTYRMGERIYPENSCYECLCTADYNNATSYADNSNCAKINCGMGLQLNDLRKGCVPIYFKTPNCCAIEYKCPSEADTIDSQSTANESQTCKFGKLNIKRGDRLKSQDSCLKCECSIPPFITCIKSC